MQRHVLCEGHSPQSTAAVIHKVPWIYYCEPGRRKVIEMRISSQNLVCTESG